VGRREFTPSLFGKANTAVQVAAVAAVLFYQLNPAPWVATLRVVTLDSTMALTVISGLHYAWVASRRVNTLTGNGHGTR